MESRTLDINVMYAKDLENVRHFKFQEMVVYVVVSISGDSQPEQKTPVDRGGGNNPSWNRHMQFIINESSAQQDRLTLVFKLQCERGHGDKDVGEVRVPVKELITTVGASKEVRRGVTTPSRTMQGELNFSYKLGEINDKAILPPNPRPRPLPESRFRRVRRAAHEALESTATAVGLGITIAALRNRGKENEPEVDTEADAEPEAEPEADAEPDAEAEVGAGADAGY
ncbi:hypothetical protein L1049_017332 [Liquidambar formosana]|uniref:C2 domain-containing protein n=1 Tax=Liquidambar formosana TaxID=63359 RepID=A0AAP0X3N0_LIQFO